jgi:hypothetical protein
VAPAVVAHDLVEAVRGERSLMQTEQMSENEVIDLARGLRQP